MFNSTSMPALNKLVGASIEAGKPYAWNGPVCPTCHRGYIGTHDCSSADLQCAIDALQARLDQARRAGR